MIRELLGDLRADASHAPETFAIYAVRTLGESVQTDAARLRHDSPDASVGMLSQHVAERGVRLAAVDGGIAGTPLYLALVPAYVAMLLEQARAVLRIAALHGRPTHGPDAAAELLALRGVHSSPGQARAAIDAKLAGEAAGLPRKRGSWFSLGRALLVLAGFLEPKEVRTPRGKMKGALLGVLGGLIWALTWIVPISFVLVMAWSGQSSTDKLVSRARRRFGERDAPLTVRGDRRALWTVALLLSAALPATVLFAAASWHPLGLGLGHGFALLAALALVFALFTRVAPVADRRLLPGEAEPTRSG